MLSTATRIEPYAPNRCALPPFKMPSAGPLTLLKGVKGFPTVKLFPRGKDQAPILFQHSERTASAFFYFATRRVPHKNKKLYHLEEIEPWVNDVRLRSTF